MVYKHTTRAERDRVFTAASEHRSTPDHVATFMDNPYAQASVPQTRKNVELRDVWDRGWCAGIADRSRRAA